MARIDCLEFKRIRKGMTSGWVDHSGVVVRTTEKLRKVWDCVYSHSVNPPEPPQVDFDKVMWICSFRGEYSTWGYTTEIVRIVEASDPHSSFIRVHVLEGNPRRGDMLKLEYAHPFDIVELDIVELPSSHKPVHFKYKERIRRR